MTIAGLQGWAKREAARYRRCSRLINQIPTPLSARRPIHASLNSQPPNARHSNLISSQSVPRDVASNPPFVILDATYLLLLPPRPTTSGHPPARARHQSNHHASRASPSQTCDEQNRCGPRTLPSVHTTDDMADTQLAKSSIRLLVQSKMPRRMFGSTPIRVRRKQAAS